MNDYQKGIITLIKSALTQQAHPLPEGFNMEDALIMIRWHHMMPLAFEGAVQCGLPQDTPAMQTMFQSYCKAIQINAGQMWALGRIGAAFHQAGIDFMPLKGCCMKPRYPKEELRSMGDGDILIRMEQYDRIVPVMESLGFTFREESNHELQWTSPWLFVELHKVLMPTYNPDFHGYFGDGWRLARPAYGTRYEMAPEDEFVYLFTHFAKHYRDGGIGCRHVADLWMFLRSFPDLDEEDVERKLEKLCLGEFHRNMRRLMAVWFQDAPGDEKTDFMTDFIFSSGSFGTDLCRVQSRAVRDTRHAPRGVGGRLVYLWQTAFPGVPVLREKYRVLQKAPWLLPVVWVVRPFYKVLCEKGTIEKQRRNLRAVRPEELQTRQDALDYVGLDYFLETEENQG